MSSPTGALVEQVVLLGEAVQELQTTAVTYTAGVVTSIDKPGLSFAANVPQPDGTDVNVAGIGVSALQFMPTVGATVSLALEGAQIIYQPVGISPGSIDLPLTSTNGPGVPNGLALTTQATVNADGTTGATITGTWTAPTTSLSGGALTEAPTYVFSYRATSRAIWTERPATTTSSTAPITSGVAYEARVASVDRLGNRSAWSPTVTITGGADATAPGMPSTPVVNNYLGQLKVTWDGFLAGGASPPTDFIRLEVFVSTTSGFVPSGQPAFSMSAGGSDYLDTPYGVTQYVKTVAVDLTGNRSQPSAQASGSTDKVVSDDILAGAVGAAQLAALSVSTANLVDAAVIQSKIGQNAVGSLQLADLAVDTASIANGAIITAKIADAAINTAKIGLLQVGTAQMADLAVASGKIADLAVVTAKIGNLAVNDAKIGSLSVGKLTAGTMSADVIISGKFATAQTGARTELNSLGFQKFRSDGSLAISLTNTQSLMTGEFMTATSGRRIEIGAGGLVGEVQFYAADGTLGFIRGFTESSGLESIQMGVQIASSSTLWNRVNVNEAEVISLHSKTVNLSTTDGLYVRTFADKTLSGTGALRMELNAGGYTLRRPNGVIFFQAIQGVAGQGVRMVPGGLGVGGIDFTENVNGTLGSARLVFTQQNNLGVSLKAYDTYFEVRDLADNVFSSITCFSVNQTSDESVKHSIADPDFRGSDLVKAMRIRSYKTPRPKRGHGVEEGETPPTEDIDQIGLVAQEAQAAGLPILGTPASDGTLSIDLYQYITVLALAQQEALERIELLEGRRGKP